MDDSSKPGFWNKFKYGFLPFIAAPIIAWWPTGWRTALHPFSKPEGGKPAAPLFAPEAAEIKTELAIAALSYHAGKGGMEVHHAIKYDTIRQYLKPYYEKLELLDSMKCDDGFYACLFRRKDTNQLCLSVAGLETSPYTILELHDTWTAFQSTAGIIPKQFGDLTKFCEKIKHDHPEGIDIVCGHSIGAYLGLCLKAGGNKYLRPDTQLFTFDSPGLSYSLKHQLANKYSLSPTQIRKNTDENVVDVVTTRNAYNTLGAQTGRYYTMKPGDKDNFFWGNILPLGHMIRVFVTGVEKPDAHFYPGDRDGNSGGPLILTGGLLAAAGLILKDKLKLKAVKPPLNAAEPPQQGRI